MPFLVYGFSLNRDPTIPRQARNTGYSRFLYPGKSSQPQMNADKHGYSMRCLYSPAHQKGERLRCINGLIHLHKSAFICG